MGTIAYAEDVPGAKQYAWYQGNSGDLTHPLTSFAPATTVSVAPASTTNYWYQLRDGACTTNSATATVSVCVPQITQQPANANITNGQSTMLTVAANTSGVTYQWYTGTAGTTTSPVTNGASASVTVNPTSTTSYWARATSTCGRTVDSNAATVTVCQPPTATLQVSNSWIMWGQNFTLRVSGSGTGITNYQWYIGSSGNTSTPVGNNVASTLVVTPTNTTTYWARVTGSCGTADTPAVTISVCATPSITTQPGSVTIYNNSSTTLSVAATDATTTPMSYQWYRGAAGDTSAPVGTSSPSYTTPALTTT